MIVIYEYHIIGPQLNDRILVSKTRDESLILSGPAINNLYYTQQYSQN